MKIGANYLGNGRCEFVCWAPLRRKVALKIVSSPECLIPMKQDIRGYWQVLAEDIYPGTKYFYRLDDTDDRPDPVSYFQPAGVHSYSQIIDHQAFEWEDNNWNGVALEKMIIYELHTGTFTPEGTFEAIIPRISELSDLGINAMEIMPVGQFPGERNWGYDGVYPFAVQNSYGGPQGLKKLINACHRAGTAAILDVVYNHFGPEGNYLESFAPYFTDKYKPPWGRAVNFDGAYCDGVRNYFIQNALYWLEFFHLDALRLDAIHGIYDFGAKHFLEEFSERVAMFSENRGRKFYLITESDLNDPKVIRERESYGYGIDAQWSDDFHHSLHTVLTGEKSGYYADFGKVKQVVKAFAQGFVYSGQYSSYRKRCHGGSSRELPAGRFVVFNQNHDQVGNRLWGERLSLLVPFEALKLAAGVMLVSPYIPLLFMGEEYAEAAPFLYFVSHSDENLIAAVKEGRRNEFQSFHYKTLPPDPQSSDTFLKSKLNWESRSDDRNKVLLEFYRLLIKLRREIPALADLNKNNLAIRCWEKKKIIFLHRWCAESKVFCLFNFDYEVNTFSVDFLIGKAKKLIDSTDIRWLGSGSTLPEILENGKSFVINPNAFVLYEMR